MLLNVHHNLNVCLFFHIVRLLNQIFKVGYGIAVYSMLLIFFFIEHILLYKYTKSLVKNWFNIQHYLLIRKEWQN